MKKTLLCILLILCLVLPACGDDAEDSSENKNYRNDASVVGLSVNALANLSQAPTFVDNDKSVLEDAKGIAFDLCDQYVIKIADGDRLDEYGIFHCKESERTDTLYKTVLNYVNARKNDTATLSQYPDADTVKNGKVSLFGDYVVYSFLADNGNTAFHDYIEYLLITE